MLAYVLDTVARTAGVGWVGALSPVRWAFGAEPLVTGFDWGGLAALFGMAMLLIGAALLVFRHRDVGMN